MTRPPGNARLLLACYRMARALLRAHRHGRRNR